MNPKRVHGGSPSPLQDHDERKQLAAVEQVLGELQRQTQRVQTAAKRLDAACESLESKVLDCAISFLDRGPSGCAVKVDAYLLGSLAVSLPFLKHAVPPEWQVRPLTDLKAPREPGQVGLLVCSPTLHPAGLPGAFADFWKKAYPQRVLVALSSSSNVPVQRGAGDLFHHAFHLKVDPDARLTWSSHNRGVLRRTQDTLQRIGMQVLASDQGRAGEPVEAAGSSKPSRLVVDFYRMGADQDLANTLGQLVSGASKRLRLRTFRPETDEPSKVALFLLIYSEGWFAKLDPTFQTRLTQAPNVYDRVVVLGLGPKGCDLESFRFTTSLNVQIVPFEYAEGDLPASQLNSGSLKTLSRLLKEAVREAL